MPEMLELAAPLLSGISIAAIAYVDICSELP